MYGRRRSGTTGTGAASGRPPSNGLQSIHEAHHSSRQAASSWQLARKKQPSFDFSPKLVSVITASLQRASWSALQAHLHDPDVPFTLCHGDFNAANMFVSGGATPAAMRITLFDWSEVRVL